MQRCSAPGSPSQQGEVSGAANDKGGWQGWGQDRGEPNLGSGPCRGTSGMAPAVRFQVRRQGRVGAFCAE